MWNQTNGNKTNGEKLMKLMKNCIEDKIRITKRRLTVLLLEKLKYRNQGTNDVEHF